jgi:3-oxoacyl-[acyl-carrier protein] reductase
VSALELRHAVLGVIITGATLVARESVAKMLETEERPSGIVAVSSISRHGDRGQSNHVAAKAARRSSSWTE